MKERPILMSAPMVRALLAGTKTQTRRAVKPAWRFERTSGTLEHNWNEDGTPVWLFRNPQDNGDYKWLPCPYGWPTQRLWVRETFWHQEEERDVTLGLIEPAWTVYRASTGECGVPRWTPSIHMPRKLSRITLDITGVHVERLQEISEADARAEGCRPTDITVDCGGAPCTAGGGYISAVESYRALWESINGAGSWDANPWVWVIAFQRINA